MQQPDFHSELLAQTAPDREAFIRIPLIARAVDTGVSRDVYLHYLEQAYHHVRQTCPLLAAALSRCTADDHHYQEALFDYLQEERGHEAWILEDIDALGGDARAVREGSGGDAVRVMVGYAFYVVEHVSPYGLLGMVHVLEGMSVLLAQRAADSIRIALRARGGAGFSYLESHGSLDQDHVAFFERLVNGIDDSRAQHVIIDTAHIMYRLYGDVFRGLERLETADRHAA